MEYGYCVFVLAITASLFLYTGYVFLGIRSNIKEKFRIVALTLIILLNVAFIVFQIASGDTSNLAATLFYVGFNLMIIIVIEFVYRLFL